MNKLTRYLHFLLCLALIIGLASCHSDDAPVDSGSIRLVFRIYMPTTTMQGRADTEGTEEGEDWECAVNPDKLHVILYTPDGKNIGALEHVVLVKTSEPNIYDVTGSMLLSKMLLTDGVFNGQIMVYANMDGVDDSADFTEAFINQLTFNRMEGKHYIPMWGLKRLGVSIVAGKQSEIGTINLLRAEAKIKVQLRQDMTANYELTQVHLSQVPSAGYSLPLYSHVRNLQDVQMLDHASFSHFMTDAAMVQDIDLSQGAIYQPEYQNQGNTHAATISLTLRDKRDGTTKDYTLPFVEYDDNGAPTDEPIDIVRNHYYLFTVYKGDDDMLAIRLSVRKWYYVQHDVIQM